MNFDFGQRVHASYKVTDAVRTIVSPAKYRMSLERLGDREGRVSFRTTFRINISPFPD